MMETAPPVALGRLLRISEVVRETGLSRATIYRRIAQRDFPDQLRFGTRTVRWSEAEVEAWKRTRPTGAATPQGAQPGASPQPAPKQPA